MAITALLVSKALVHSLVLSNVILGAVWIFSDDTPVRNAKLQSHPFIRWAGRTHCSHFAEC